MRKYIDTIVENMALVPLTEKFAQQVRKMANKIARDIADDLPKNNNDLLKIIEHKLSQIDQYCGIDAVMMVGRAELRNKDDLPDCLSDVGCHWCWSGDERVYHHENAYDEYGQDDLVEVGLVAKVNIRDIDWVFTIATNLILPGEGEITIKSGATVKLVDVFVDGNDILHGEMQAYVNGDYVPY